MEQQQQQVQLSVDEIIKNLRDQLSQAVLQKSDYDAASAREEDKITKIRDTLQGMELAINAAAPPTAQFEEASVQEVPKKQVKK